MTQYLHKICTNLAKIVQNCTKLDKFEAKMSLEFVIKTKEIANLSN